MWAAPDPTSFRANLAASRMILVGRPLRQTLRFQRCGRLPPWYGLEDPIPFMANRRKSRRASDHAQMIRDFSIRRDLMQIGKDITEKAASVDVSTDPAKQISEAEQALCEVAESGRFSTGSSPSCRRRVRT